MFCVAATTTDFLISLPISPNTINHLHQNTLDNMSTMATIICCLLLSLTISLPLFNPQHSTLSHSQSTPFCGLTLATPIPSFLTDNIQGGFYLDSISLRKQILTSNACKKTHMIVVESEGKKGAYNISISEGAVTVEVSCYSGYVYALQTIFELGQKGTLPLGQIRDSPQVEYRGIMIDSVRHFLSVEAIKRTIKAMAIVRLNVLHWHLTDDEAFTLTLQKHPEMIEGSYDKNSRYSLEQVKDIIEFAKQHAVDVVPQIDTPGHVRSWGQNSKHANITIKCPGGEGYNNQLDLSIDDVWTLGREIIAELGQIFSTAPYLHLGGDEVFASCWNLRPEIKTWMAEHNISTYGQLQMAWRESLISAIPNRTVIFWRNDDSEVVIKDDQIIHYWGSQSDVQKITNNSNAKMILSPSNYLYLNSGQGFVTGKTFGHYSTWRQIYQGWQLFPEGVKKERVLGALVALWGEVSNENTLDINLWPRATVFAHMVWSDEKPSLKDLVQKILDTNKEFQQVGVYPSPIVPEACHQNLEECGFSSQNATVIEVVE